MTSEQAIKILRMNEQQRWQSGVDDRDVQTAINLATSALSRLDAKKPTHEATLPKAFTCPTCKNVIDSFMTVFGQKIRVMEVHCRFCGQKIDWSEVSKEYAEV